MVLLCFWIYPRISCLLRPSCKFSVLSESHPSDLNWLPFAYCPPHHLGVWIQHTWQLYLHALTFMKSVRNSGYAWMPSGCVWGWGWYQTSTKIKQGSRCRISCPIYVKSIYILLLWASEINHRHKLRFTHLLTVSLFGSARWMNSPFAFCAAERFSTFLAFKFCVFILWSACIALEPLRAKTQLVHFNMNKSANDVCREPNCTSLEDGIQQMLLAVPSHFATWNRIHIPLFNMEHKSLGNFLAQVSLKRIWAT